MVNIVENYNKIFTEISDFKKKKKIQKNLNIIAVSKTFSFEKIKPLVLSGHKIFGENKVQEANLKWTQVKKKFKDLEIHLIGPLQSNKVKLALETFDCIHTIDREKIVLKICDQINNNEIFKAKKIKFFVQINIGSEIQKSGIAESEVLDFVKWCKNDRKMNIIGLMCIPPYNDNPDPYFKKMNEIAIKLGLNEISMGMSKDYISAINYGATYVRIGSNIFGQRI